MSSHGGRNSSDEVTPKARYHFSDIIGNSREITAVIKHAVKFARSDLNILICGETGSGKELFAQSIHNESPRSSGPFVAINCATLPPALLESELFGYESGAFTGASKYGKRGLFEVAHKGTIFLDEIGELPLEIQPRLLRVIEEKEVRRLGGAGLIPVDVRVIAATNRDLGQMVAEKTFRADLFFRLNTLTLRIPPLRDRRDDIPAIALSFLQNALETSGLEHVRGDMEALLMRVLSELRDYQWPGNVRELKNLVYRIVAGYSLIEEGSLVVEQLLEEVPKGEGGNIPLQQADSPIKSVPFYNINGKGGGGTK